MEINNKKEQDIYDAIFKTFSSKSQTIIKLIESGKDEVEVANLFNISVSRARMIYKEFSGRVRYAQSIGENSIALLSLTTRTYNSLRRAKINTIDELNQMILEGKLNLLRNIGEASKKEIINQMKEKGYNYNLKDDYEFKILWSTVYGRLLQEEYGVRRVMKCRCVDLPLKKSYTYFFVEVTNNNEYNLYFDNRILSLPDSLIIQKIKQLEKEVN